MGPAMLVKKENVLVKHMLCYRLVNCELGSLRICIYCARMH